MSEQTIIDSKKLLLETENERNWHQGEYFDALKTALDIDDEDKRLDPKTAEMIYHGLKKEIDMVNDKPENNRYLDVFSKWERIHKMEWLDIIDEIKKRISTVNFKTNTSKAKYEDSKEREDVEINQATIDGKGVYKILELLSKNKIIDKLNINFLEGTKKATEGITINQEWVGKNEWIRLIKNRETIRAKTKNKEENKDPYEKMIIDINSNLQESEGATSSTRMLYEICKKAGLIAQLPQEEQETLERFVYFVDFAYRYKQRILGIDQKYMYGTLFGNYKKLRLSAIRWYFKLKSDQPKTGFEVFSPEEANSLLLPVKIKNEEGKKIIGRKQMDEVIDEKVKEIKVAMEEIDTLGEVASLTYPGTEGYKPQRFIFDLENKIPLLEEAAPRQEAWFIKLHKKNNELYIRAYYDIPQHFWWFTIENGNTGHFKLTEENLEKFLGELQGDEEIKDQIREQLKINNFPKLVPIKGEEFEGTIIQKKAKTGTNDVYGVKIKLSKEGHKPVRWLLHISNVENINDFKKGEKIKVEVDRVSKEGIALKRVDESLKIGAIVDGTIKNITDFWAFVTLGNTGDSGLIYRKNIDLNKIKIWDPITVKIDSIEKDPKHEGKKRIWLIVAIKKPEVKKMEIKKMNTPVNNGLQEKINNLPKNLIIKTGMRLSWVIENIKEGLGAFVKVERNADGKKWRWGLLHISEIEGDGALKKLSIGQEIDVVVKSIKDTEQKRINFQLPWKPASEKDLHRLQKKFNNKKIQ